MQVLNYVIELPSFEEHLFSEKKGRITLVAKTGLQNEYLCPKLCILVYRIPLYWGPSDFSLLYVTLNRRVNVTVHLNYVTLDPPASR